MVALFQEFLASMAKKEEVAKVSYGQHVSVEIKDKEKVKGTETPHVYLESLTQGEARDKNANNNPYCYHCLTRGHPKEKCVTPLFCDICESATHVKSRCPLLKKAKNMYAMMCGYAVDGLGFYYISHSVAIRPRAESKTPIVQVVNGEMNAIQVKSEIERLVPGKMIWVSEEVAKNNFKMGFLTKGKRLIEWGVIQTKDRKAKLVIEEGDGKSNNKQVMRKVWVHMTKLPSELLRLSHHLGNWHHFRCNKRC
jgi:hypothetical protein